MKLAILLIVALLAGTVECAASCAAVTSESPCHHDKQSVAACSHELVMQRTQATAIVPAIFTPSIVHCFAIPLDSPIVERRIREDARPSVPLRV
jgi:hypothetical protein